MQTVLCPPQGRNSLRVHEGITGRNNNQGWFGVEVAVHFLLVSADQWGSRNRVVTRALDLPSHVVLRAAQAAVGVSVVPQGWATTYTGEDRV